MNDLIEQRQISIVTETTSSNRTENESESCPEVLHLSDELLSPKVMFQYDPERDVVYVEDLCKTYYLEDGRPIEILKHISLSYDSAVFPIQKGEFVIIRGPSGGGKTTYAPARDGHWNRLLNIIGTLDTPTNGTVRLLGNTINFKNNDDQLAHLRLKEVQLPLPPEDLDRICLSNIQPHQYDDIHPERRAADVSLRRPERIRDPQARHRVVDER